MNARTVLKDTRTVNECQVWMEVERARARHRLISTCSQMLLSIPRTSTNYQEVLGGDLGSFPPKLPGKQSPFSQSQNLLITRKKMWRSKRANCAWVQRTTAASGRQWEEQGLKKKEKVYFSIREFESSSFSNADECRHLFFAFVSLLMNHLQPTHQLKHSSLTELIYDSADIKYAVWSTSRGAPAIIRWRGGCLQHGEICNNPPTPKCVRASSRETLL